MSTPKDIDFLIQLLDDPAHDVFDQVKTKILELGKDAYPQLLSESEINADPLVQERLHMLLQQIDADTAFAEFQTWTTTEDANLLDAMIILSKANNKFIDPYMMYSEIAQMEKNIWLEYNEYLTPLEQINVFINIIYNFYNIRHFHQQDTKSHSKFHFLDNVFNLKMGSTTAIDILYLIMFRKFEVPMTAYLLPNGNTILAYKDAEVQANRQQILCFLFSSYGELLSYSDIYQNLKSMQSTMKLEDLIPLDNKQVIKHLLQLIIVDFEQEKNDERLRLFKRFEALLY